MEKAEFAKHLFSFTCDLNYVLATVGQRNHLNLFCDRNTEVDNWFADVLLQTECLLTKSLLSS